MDEFEDEWDNNPKNLFSSDEIIRNLQIENAALKKENQELRKKSGEYLSKWVAAQDLAAHRNMLLFCQK